MCGLEVPVQPSSSNSNGTAKPVIETTSADQQSTSVVGRDVPQVVWMTRSRGQRTATFQRTRRRLPPLRRARRKTRAVQVRVRRQQLDRAGRNWSRVRRPRAIAATTRSHRATIVRTRRHLETVARSRRHHRRNRVLASKVAARKRNRHRTVNNLPARGKKLVKRCADQEPTASTSKGSGQSAKETDTDGHKSGEKGGKSSSSDSPLEIAPSTSELDDDMSLLERAKRAKSTVKQATRASRQEEDTRRRDDRTGRSRSRDGRERSSTPTVILSIPVADRNAMKRCCVSTGDTLNVGCCRLSSGAS